MTGPRTCHICGQEALVGGRPEEWTHVILRAPVKGRYDFCPYHTPQEITDAIAAIIRGGV